MQSVNKYSVDMVNNRRWSNYRYTFNWELVVENKLAIDANLHFNKVEGSLILSLSILH